MSLDQYNSLMSSMLNQQHALTKLRAELEERDEKKCWSCEKFGHLACNCRNKNEEECHDMAKQLSYYLYLFSFLFI